MRSAEAASANSSSDVGSPTHGREIAPNAARSRGVTSTALDDAAAAAAASAAGAAGVRRGPSPARTQQSRRGQHRAQERDRHRRSLVGDHRESRRHGHTNGRFTRRPCAFRDASLGAAPAASKAPRTTPPATRRATPRNARRRVTDPTGTPPPPLSRQQCRLPWSDQAVRVHSCGVFPHFREEHATSRAEGGHSTRRGSSQIDVLDHVTPTVRNSDIGSIPFMEGVPRSRASPTSHAAAGRSAGYAAVTASRQGSTVRSRRRLPDDRSSGAFYSKAPLPLAKRCRPSHTHPSTTTIRTPLRRVRAAIAAGKVIQRACRAVMTVHSPINNRIAA